MPDLAMAFRKRHVNLLYHLTHIDNIPSVLEKGILSRNLLAEIDLTFRDISLPNAQRKRSRLLIGDRLLHNYVPLFMNPRSPMYYSLLGQLGHSLSCLVISVDVTSKPDVHFSDGNLAYGKKLRVFSRPEEVRSLNFLDVMESLGSNIARAAEVLIPDMVEIAHIRKVCVTDQGVIDSLPAAPIGISYHRLSW